MDLTDEKLLASSDHDMLRIKLRKDKEEALFRRQEKITEKKQQRKEKQKKERESHKSERLINQKEREKQKNEIAPAQCAVIVANKKKSKNSAKKKSKVQGNKYIEEKRKYEREKKRKQREKIRANPESYAKYCLHERERNERRKKEGKLKSIHEKSQREQRRQRKMWREQKAKKEEKVKEEKKLQDYLQNISPPSSAEASPAAGNIHFSCQKMRGRKSLRRDRSKVVRQLKKSEDELKKNRTLLEKWKKRYLRLKNSVSNGLLSPRKKVKITLQKGAQEVKKKLLFGEVMVSQMKHNSKIFKDAQSKQLFAKSISGNLYKKYRCLRLANLFLSKKMNSRYNVESCSLKYYRKKRKDAIQKDLKKAVVSFLEQDEHSSMAPGKKDTKTVKKEKKQKRFLLDTLVNLHKIFLKDTSMSISYPTFCRLKPYWIVRPNINRRDTCLCVRHANFQFLVDRLHQHKIVKDTQTSTLVEKLCCNKQNKDCMYNECSRCQNKSIGSSVSAEKRQQSTFYYKWITKKETRKIRNGKNKKISFVVKEKITCTVENLLSETQKHMMSFLIHVFNVWHQHSFLKQLKNVLKQNEVLVVVDFSENYVSKYAAEIQSVHFGASKGQITIHTGVIYSCNMQAVSDSNNDNSFIALDTETDTREQALQCCQFATVSDSMRHDPAAVWAHMQPILQMITATYPYVDVIHFQSDGPVTQYKNRTHFYLMTHFAKELNMKSVTWNFSEPGHGKSVADGVGGQLKSRADMLVSYGNDITDANSFLASLEKSKVGVNLFHINVSEIEMIDKIIPDKLSNVPSIMKLRQITWNNLSANHLYLRTLSCITCDTASSCKHFSPHQSVSTFCFDIYSTQPNVAETVSLSANEKNPIGAKCIANKEVQVQRETELRPALRDYICCVYDKDWWLGEVVEVKVYENEEEFRIHYFHPRGPGTSFKKSINDYKTWVQKKNILKILTPSELFLAATGRGHNITPQMNEHLSTLLNENMATQ